MTYYCGKKWQLKVIFSLLFISNLKACGGGSGGSGSSANNDNNIITPETPDDVVIVEPPDTHDTSDPITPPIVEPSSIVMTLSNAAFKDTGSELYNLPLKYTCDGSIGGISPRLFWSTLPDDTTHVALTMRSNSINETQKQLFTLYNIPAEITTLPEGDFSIGQAARGDFTDIQLTQNNGIAYVAPCPSGAGDKALYTITLYALSAPIDIAESSTQEAVIETLSQVLIQSYSLTTQYKRFDQNALANNAHVPTSGVTSCAEKIAHFNQYASVHDSITCDENNNQLSVVSHISDGLKTSLPDQQIQVGISRWIGRLPLVSQAGSDIRITPSFHNKVNDNLGCDGTEFLGVTVDGQVILPFFKQSNVSGNSACGPTDGDNYADRDTVVLGEVDQCYGHSPNGEGYHLHGAPVCLMDVHDPSQPIAYMADGIPLYFGQAGGKVIDTPHAQTAKTVTDLNYGGGLYEHLDYRPSDVKDGSNPLNECNAYDINGDGDVSGYVYYSSQDAPYTIGCFMGEKLADPKKVAVTRTQLERERIGWSGQMMGEAIDVSIISSRYGSHNDKTYNITEMLVNQSTAYLTAGDYAQVLWRVLSEEDSGYEANRTCFEFRYRADKSVVNNDEVEAVCTRTPIPNTTLNFTPFGDEELTGEEKTQHSFKLEAWADNWFAAYVGDALIVEDTTAITTEKSFNAETSIFESEYPITLSFMIKDFKENNTGLEYIGEPNQQMGDGGFIAQITDVTTGSLVAVTNESWACTVIHQAPIDKSCANEATPIAGQGACDYSIVDVPNHWKEPSFDDSSWNSTRVYSEAEVSPKDGYDEITWDPNAQLIWGPDLETDNTLLCRVTITQ